MLVTTIFSLDVEATKVARRADKDAPGEVIIRRFRDWTLEDAQEAKARRRCIMVTEDFQVRYTHHGPTSSETLHGHLLGPTPSQAQEEALSMLKKLSV